MMEDAESASSDWRVMGRRMPKTEIVFFCQIVIIYVVVVTCIINLSIGNSDSNLWTALLSSCLGYLLPQPSMKEARYKTRRCEATATTSS
jgi:hypothetical protein